MKPERGESMKKFLVIRTFENKDYFHSIIKSSELQSASDIFREQLDESPVEEGVYQISPLVDYHFDENHRIVIPEGTDIELIFVFPINM